MNKKEIIELGVKIDKSLKEYTKRKTIELEDYKNYSKATKKMILAKQECIYESVNVRLIVTSIINNESRSIKEVTKGKRCVICNIILTPSESYKSNCCDKCWLK